MEHKKEYGFQYTCRKCGHSAHIYAVFHPVFWECDRCGTRIPKEDIEVDRSKTNPKAVVPKVKFNLPMGASKGGKAIMEYRTTIPITDDIAREQIIRAYNKVKNNVGYATYTAIKKETGLPYKTILGVLKQEHINDPRQIHFNVDRMGKNIFFKYDKKPIMTNPFLKPRPTESELKHINTEWEKMFPLRTCVYCRAEIHTKLPMRFCPKCNRSWKEKMPNPLYCFDCGEPIRSWDEATAVEYNGKTVYVCRRCAHATLAGIRNPVTRCWVCERLFFFSVSDVKKVKRKFWVKCPLCGSNVSATSRLTDLEVERALKRGEHIGPLQPTRNPIRHTKNRTSVKKNSLASLALISLGIWLLARRH